MKKLFLICIVTLVFSVSCGWNVSTDEIDYANDLCNNNGGLLNIRYNPMSNNTATCNNGARFKLPVKYINLNKSKEN